MKNSDFGGGLNGSFYNNRDLTGDAVATETDKTVDFKWGRNPPKGLKRSTFRAR